jgi:putative ABC transport system permease protein
MIFAIPLAWLQLTRQRIRFLVTLAGITFVVILISMQVGFQDALYSSATLVHANLKGDLFLISPQYRALTSQQPFPRSRLYQTLGFDGVESVSPLYFAFAKLKNPDNGKKNTIYVIGVDPAAPALKLPELSQNKDKIKVPDAVLYDRKSRPEFGPIAQEVEQGKKEEIEIFDYNQDAGYRVKVAGLFSLGPSFGVDGNLIMSYLTFLQIYHTRQPDYIDVGAITLKPGADIQKVHRALQANLPKDIEVLTKKEFSDMEKQYWALRTPIGFVFTLSVSMAFTVGIAVVYQILYSNISNHLIEYATLKAMGFKNKYLMGVVFQQASLLAVLGYIPGFAISLGLYDLAKEATHLPVIMSFDKALMVLISVSLMCFISGAIAMNRLRSADPADIF